MIVVDNNELTITLIHILIKIKLDNKIETRKINNFKLINLVCYF